MVEDTPFYAESGGQVGDKGSIENEIIYLDVFDVKLADGFIVHKCLLKKGKVSLNAKVHLKIDNTRRTKIKG